MVIVHDDLYNKDFKHSVIHLQDNSVNTIAFPELIDYEPNEKPFMSMFRIKDDCYYFLFENRLYVYSFNTEEIKLFELKEMGIHQAHALYIP